MKNIAIVILLSLLFAITCDGQIQLKDSVLRIKLTPGTQKIDTNQLFEKKPQHKYLNINPRFKYTFQKGDVLICLNDSKLTEPVDTAHLKELKIGFDHDFKQIKFSTYQSKLQTFHNNKFLIYNSESDDSNYYWFLGFDKTYLKGLSGVILYLKPDSEIARKVLNEILSRAKFK